MEQLVRDLTHFRLADGSIACALGDQLLGEKIYADVAFVPSPDGPYISKTNTRYRKPYLTDHHGRVQEAARVTLPPASDATITLPGVLIYADSIVETFTPEQMRSRAMTSKHARNIRTIEKFVADLAGAQTDDLDFGLIGSVGLDLSMVDGSNPHDWDLVVTSGRATREALVEKLQMRVLSDAKLRVFEYGKGWLIRQWVGDLLLCPFFRERVPEMVSIEEWNHDLTQIRGTVVDGLDSVLVPGRVRANVDGRTIDVYIFGLRSRGDFRAGGSFSATGRWCSAVVGTERMKVFAIVDDDHPVRVTPPWTNYYAHA